MKSEEFYGFLYLPQHEVQALTRVFCGYDMVEFRIFTSGNGTIFFHLARKATGRMSPFLEKSRLYYYDI